MAEVKDVSFYREMMDTYYNNAIRCQAAGNYTAAKKYYMLAAQKALETSKYSSQQLKASLIKKAKMYQENAEACGDRKRPAVRRVPGTGDNSQGGQQQEQDEDNGKIWQGSAIPDIKFSDVAGLEDVKKTILTRMINPIKYPEKYAKYGKKMGGGVLLYGPPGTGKTLIAKAIAGEVGATFYAIKGSDILSKYVGESEKNISSLFEAAKKDKLAIIFIDEMDSLFGQRGQDMHNDKRVNEFLQQIDGFASKTDNLLLLGATNRPWDVDSAAVRSGRFSEKIYVSLPDAPAREYMFNKQLNNVPLGKDVDIKKLVKVTEGYSGADIAEVCDRAKEDPLNNYIKTDVLTDITMKDFVKALSKVPPTVKQKDLKAFEEYAGRTGGTVKKEKEDETVEVTFAEDVINMKAGEKPSVEFSVSKELEKVYLQVNGANYLCSKKFNSWVSEPLNIEKPGEYEVIISSQNEIARKKIKFNKGLEEDDLGL